MTLEILSTVESAIFKASKMRHLFVSLVTCNVYPGSQEKATTSLTMYLSPVLIPLAGNIGSGHVVRPTATGTIKQKSYRITSRSITSYHDDTKIKCDTVTERFWHIKEVQIISFLRITVCSQPFLILQTKTSLEF